MQLWTAEHIKTLLPALAVMIVLTCVLRLLLKNKPLKIRMIPIQVLACIILALEIGKQACSFSRGYDLYHIPLHFCSIILFVLPFMAFYRGKHQQLVYGMTAGLCTAIALMMLIYPELIYGSGDIQRYFQDYFAFHTVTFHNIVLFVFLLIPALEIHIPNAKAECKALAVFIMVFCAISASMAQILKTNYNNFYSCNIAPLEAVRISLQSVLGYGVTQMLYVAIVVVLDILFVQLSYLTYRGLLTLLRSASRVKSK